VTDVVGDEYMPLGRGFVQKHRICGALLQEVINAVGINPSLP
jgi:hypothetical protein